MRKLIALWFGSGEPNDPEETRIVEIVRDLSGDDAAAMATARTVIRDGLPADSDYAHVYRSARTYALVAHSLARHRRLIALDWKEDWDESTAWFSDLFEAAGIDSGHPLRPFRRRDGDVQDALAVYTVLAEQAGLRIVQLVTDSDMYEFALTSADRADRWSGATLGHDARIERAIAHDAPPLPGSIDPDQPPDDTLINRIAGGIANEPALMSVDWVSASVVFEFQPDGFCSGHFGYAYSADGAATPFTVNDHAASYAASDYRSWIAVNHGFGVAQMLFQFDRRSMRFHVEFGYDDGPSWRVTPANLDTIVSELRPRLNTPGA